MVQILTGDYKAGNPYRRQMLVAHGTVIERDLLCWAGELIDPVIYPSWIGCNPSLGRWCDPMQESLDVMKTALRALTALTEKCQPSRCALDRFAGLQLRTPPNVVC